MDENYDQGGQQGKTPGPESSSAIFPSYAHILLPRILGVRRDPTSCMGEGARRFPPSLSCPPDSPRAMHVFCSWKSGRTENCYPSFPSSSVLASLPLPSHGVLTHAPPHTFRERLPACVLDCSHPPPPPPRIETAVSPLPSFSSYSADAIWRPPPSPTPIFEEEEEKGEAARVLLFLRIYRQILDLFPPSPSSDPPFPFSFVLCVFYLEVRRCPPIKTLRRRGKRKRKSKKGEEWDEQAGERKSIEWLAPSE